MGSPLRSRVVGSTPNGLARPLGNSIYENIFLKFGNEYLNILLRKWDQSCYHAVSQLSLGFLARRYYSSLLYLIRCVLVR